MEQTLGNRIVTHRKRLGLTQEQLAKALGVTAQAVSKWENDQSCPDVILLPKLADIFGISTDELLGRTPIHKAEILPDEDDDEDDEEDDEGFHMQKGNWEFHWDSGRKSALLFALYVLLVGVLSILSHVFALGADLWDIAWPAALLMLGIGGMTRRFGFFNAGCLLVGAYYLIENLNVWQFNLAGELVFPLVVVLFGLSLLVDALRKPAKPRVHIRRKGKSGKEKSSFTTHGESFQTDLSFGESVRVVSMERLAEGQMNVSFGELVIDLSDVEELAPGCRLEANCAFGALEILVPKRWRLEADNTGTAFGNISFVGHPDEAAQDVIYLEGNASFGEIRVKYID